MGRGLEAGWGVRVCRRAGAEGGSSLQLTVGGVAVFDERGSQPPLGRHPRPAAPAAPTAEAEPAEAPSSPPPSDARARAAPPHSQPRSSRDSLWPRRRVVGRTAPQGPAGEETLDGEI